MKIILNIFIIYSIVNNVMAAQLNDVKILEITPSENKIELKLQTKNASKGSYFLVDIMKNDVDSFNKLILVIKKIKLKDQFQLNLEIRSFSKHPPGSYYRSKDVIFSGK